MAKTVVFLTKKQATVLCLITDQRSGYFRVGFYNPPIHKQSSHYPKNYLIDNQEDK